MQRVTPGIGDTFGPVLQALQETFILALYQSLVEGTPGREFTRLPVKQALLDLSNPTKTSPENWTTYFFITGHLVAALRGKK